MKKSEIPKPKYSIGDIVVYKSQPLTDTDAGRKEVCKIDAVSILVTKSETHIQYGFDGAPPSLKDDDILRRVHLA